MRRVIWHYMQSWRDIAMEPEKRKRILDEEMPVAAAHIENLGEKQQTAFDIMNWLYRYHSYAEALNVKGLVTGDLKRGDARRQVEDKEAIAALSKDLGINSYEITRISVIPDPE